MCAPRETKWPSGGRGQTAYILVAIALDNHRSHTFSRSRWHQLIVELYISRVALSETHIDTVQSDVRYGVGVNMTQSCFISKQSYPQRQLKPWTISVEYTYTPHDNEAAAPVEIYAFSTQVTPLLTPQCPLSSSTMAPPSPSSDSVPVCYPPQTSPWFIV